MSGGASATGVAAAGTAAAGTAAAGISATTVAIAAGAGIAASVLLASKASAKTPDVPTIETPQTSKSPDEVARRKTRTDQNTAAAAPGGLNNTLLTSAGGVDINSLNLGKSRLLGQ